MLITTQEIIRQSWGLYVKNFKRFIPYILLALIPNLILSATGLASLFLDEFIRNNTLAITNTLAVLLIIAAGIIFSIWANVALIKNIRELMLNNQPLKIKEALRISSPLIFPIIYTSILVGVFILLGMVLFIIPGIIISVWLCFVYYLVIFENRAGWSAIKQSKKMVSGRWWKILVKILIPGLIFGIIISLANQMLTSTANLLINGQVDKIWVNGVITVLIGAITGPLVALPGVILYFSAKENPITAPTVTPPETPNQI